MNVFRKSNIVQSYTSSLARTICFDNKFDSFFSYDTAKEFLTSKVPLIYSNQICFLLLDSERKLLKCITIEDHGHFDDASILFEYINALKMNSSCKFVYMCFSSEDRPKNWPLCYESALSSLIKTSCEMDVNFLRAFIKLELLKGVDFDACYMGLCANYFMSNLSNK